MQDAFTPVCLLWFKLAPQVLHLWFVLHKRGQKTLKCGVCQTADRVDGSLYAKHVTWWASCVPQWCLFLAGNQWFRNKEKEKQKGGVKAESRKLGQRAGLCVKPIKLLTCYTFTMHQPFSWSALRHERKGRMSEDKQRRGRRWRSEIGSDWSPGQIYGLLLIFL